MGSAKWTDIYLITSSGTLISASALTVAGASLHPTLRSGAAEKYSRHDSKEDVDAALKSGCVGGGRGEGRGRTGK